MTEWIKVCPVSGITVQKRHCAVAAPPYSSVHCSLRKYVKQYVSKIFYNKCILSDYLIWIRIKSIKSNCSVTCLISQSDWCNRLVQIEHQNGKKGGLSDFECGTIVGASLVFQTLVIFCSFPTQPSQNQRIISSSLDKDVKEELVNCFQPRWAKEHLWIHNTSETTINKSVATVWFTFYNLKSNY